MNPFSYYDEVELRFSKLEMIISTLRKFCIESRHVHVIKGWVEEFSTDFSNLPSTLRKLRNNIISVERELSSNVHTENGEDVQ